MRAAYVHTALAWTTLALTVLCSRLRHRPQSARPARAAQPQGLSVQRALDKAVTKPVAEGYRAVVPAAGARRHHQLVRQLPRRHHGGQQPAAAEGAACGIGLRAHCHQQHGGHPRLLRCREPPRAGEARRGLRADAGPLGPRSGTILDAAAARPQHGSRHGGAGRRLLHRPRVLSVQPSTPENCIVFGDPRRSTCAPTCWRSRACSTRPALDQLRLPARCVPAAPAQPDLRRQPAAELQDEEAHRGARRSRRWRKSWTSTSPRTVPTRHRRLSTTRHRLRRPTSPPRAQ